MKRKAIIAFTALVFLAVVFYGTSQARTMAPGLRVGVLVSNSGPLYFAGAFQKAAVELAKKDLAKTVGLEITFQDPGDSEVETNSALRYFAKQNVELILAPIETDSVRRVLKSKDLPEVPIIAPSSLSENLAGNKKVFRLATTLSQDSVALAKFIALKDHDVVAVVSASDDYSKAVSRSVAFGLSLRSVRVKSHQFSENQALRSIKADALVLVSMEQSAELLSKLPNWLNRFDRVYLVPGNLANYSAFSFASELAGATGLLAAEEHSQAFRQRLAIQMGRQEILGAPNSPMFGLARRSYQALVLAADQIRNQGNLSDLGKSGFFSAEGYYLGQRYSVLRYSTAGVYSVIGSFDPKIP